LGYAKAIVGSHLGVRILIFAAKKPSNVRISTKNILTFDGSARGLASSGTGWYERSKAHRRPPNRQKGWNNKFSN
jgi:hypothetical protein